MAGTLRERARRLMLAVGGQPVSCRVCGRPLARRVAVTVRGGRVRVLGLGGAVVRVRFAEPDELAFEHADSRLCERHVEPPPPGTDAPAA